MADDRRGCFLTSVGAEFDDRPGPIRDAVITALSRWSAYVLDEIRSAIGSGDLPQDTDPDQLAFELNGVVLATAQAVQLHHDPLAAARARHALARLLPS